MVTLMPTGILTKKKTMNKTNTEIKRWGIVVIQSLSQKDIKTGERESIMMYFGINVIRRNEFILSYII